MTQDGRMWILHSLNDAGSLPSLLQSEAAVNARNNEVKTNKYLVWIVQGAVGQNVRFDSLQNPETLAGLPVEPIDLTMLLGDLINRQASSIMRRLGMIRDTEILKTASAGRFHHRGQRVGAV